MEGTAGSRHTAAGMRPQFAAPVMQGTMQPSSPYQVFVLPIALLEVWPELVRSEGVHSYRVNIMLSTM